jgi:hypothetical protein
MTYEGRLLGQYSAATKVVLERIALSRRSRPVASAMPRGSGVRQAFCTRTLLDAVASGELMPDKGATMSSTLSTHLEVIESADTELKWGPPVTPLPPQCLQGGRSRIQR